MPTNRLLVVALLLAPGVGRAQDAASAAKIRVDAQMTCGTRVAEFVLDWCGRPADSADLLWELQGGRPDKLVSVADLTRALEERGLQTRTVRADPPGVVEWNGPVIYHTLNTNGVGHFFVQTPPRGDYPRLTWCNVEGFSKELPPQYAGGLSGVMVLVSETPIGDTQSLAVGPRTGQRLADAGDVVGGGVGRGGRGRGAGLPAPAGAARSGRSFTWGMSHGDDVTNPGGARALGGRGVGGRVRRRRAVGQGAVGGGADRARRWRG